jgi:hypothetical protein
VSLPKKVDGREGSETWGFGGGGAGKFRSVSSGFSAARVLVKRTEESTPRSDTQKTTARINLFMLSESKNRELDSSFRGKKQRGFL